MAADAAMIVSRDPMIISIGECMVEMARAADGRFGLAYGGDTFNTAVYLARAGATVSYATALGELPCIDQPVLCRSQRGMIFHACLPFQKQNAHAGVTM